MRIDAAMLFYLRGNLDTGLYAAPYRLVEGLYSVTMVLCVTALPRLSRAWADSASGWRGEWTHALGFLAVLIGAPILVLAAVPGVLIQMLYGPSYAPAVSMLRILTPASLLLCVGAMVGIGLTSIGREHAQLKLTAIALLVNVLLNYVLIPRLGGIGAALATLLAALVYVGIGAVILYRSSASHGAR
jgi:O-antigen/teichoic acid export membrane protein